jgi:alkylhydroperoxidase family enzyme
LARRLGATEEQLDAVARADYRGLEDGWRVAFQYADALTPTPGIVPDDVYAALAAHWNPAQIVEITSVICMFNFFNRFAHALDIPVTR